MKSAVRALIALVVMLMCMVTHAAPTTQADGQQATTQPAAILSVGGQVPNPLSFDQDSWKQLPRHQVKAKNRDGSEAIYEGVLVVDVLRKAGIGLGDHKMNRANVPLYVRVLAADGYKAVFALVDFDADIEDRSILLADQKDGQPIGDKEGPLRLIVPHDSMPVRWVRQVQSLTVLQSE